MRLECGCPDNYPEWDGENIDLSGQPVHIMPIPTFLHMPLSFETFLSRQWHEIEQLGLKEKWPGLVLSQTGFFRGKIISLLESGDSPARHVQYLPMHFHMRGMLHKGNIGSTKESISKLQSVIFDEGHMPKELFLC